MTQPCNCENSEFTKAQVFGLRAAIVASFFFPTLIWCMIFAAGMFEKHVEIHEAAAITVCVGNFASIIAFGFGGPAVLRRRQIKGQEETACRPAIPPAED